MKNTLHNASLFSTHNTVQIRQW